MFFLIIFREGDKFDTTFIPIKAFYKFNIKGGRVKNFFSLCILFLALLKDQVIYLGDWAEFLRFQYCYVNHHKVAIKIFSTLESQVSPE